MIAKSPYWLDPDNKKGRHPAPAFVRQGYRRVRESTHRTTNGTMRRHERWLTGPPGAKCAKAAPSQADVPGYRYRAGDVPFPKRAFRTCSSSSLLRSRYVPIALCMSIAEETLKASAKAAPATAVGSRRLVEVPSEHGHRQGRGRVGPMGYLLALSRRYESWSVGRRCLRQSKVGACPADRP